MSAQFELTPVLKQRFLSSSGAPLAGGLVYSYAAGTTTPLATYTDSTGATPNTNPVVLDPTGSAEIWMSQNSYKFVVYDSASNLQFSVDNVQSIGTQISQFIQSYTTTATAAGTTTLTAASTQQQFFTGSTTQTVLLPVTSTLTLGQTFLIQNRSSGVVTVQSSGGNTIKAMEANSQMLVTCISLSGTGASSWDFSYQIAQGLLPIADGGTAVSSVTTSPTASSFAGWDSNKNFSGNNLINGYTTTATAAGTTTLTVSSTFQQYFTGSTTQTVVLPVTNTLVLGQTFQIVNLSSGTVTVQSSGANTIQAMSSNTMLSLTCISTSGTGTSSWSWAYQTLIVGAPSADSWAGYHDGGYNWSTASATFADPTTNTTGTFTQRDNHNFGTVTTSGGPDITFTPSATGRYRISAITTMVNSTATNNCFYRLYDGTTEIKNSAGSQGTSGAQFPAVLEGIYNATSTAAKTIKIQLRAGAGTVSMGGITSTCSSIEWAIFKIS